MLNQRESNHDEQVSRRSHCTDGFDDDDVVVVFLRLRFYRSFIRVLRRRRCRLLLLLFVAVLERTDT